MPLYPVLGPLVTVFVTITLTFAQVRYRAAAEGAIVVLAAVGVDALWRARDRRAVSEPELELSR